jgi:C-terminal processing protease CtpA/Prc
MHGLEARFALALTLTVACAAMCYAAEPDPGVPANTERRFSVDEARSELQALYRGLQSAAYDLYAFTTKAELERAYDEVDRTLDRADPASSTAKPSGPLTLTRFEVKTRLQLFAAAVRMGHARVEGPASDWAQHVQGEGRSFPLSLRFVKGRAYVSQNLSGVDGVRRGDELLAIDGQPMSQWRQRTARHVSAETDAMADSILEYDFPMYLWVEAGARENFDVEIKQAGRPNTFHMRARTAAEQERFRANQPPALDLEHPLRDARVLPGGIGYLRPGAFYNMEAKTGTDAWDVSGFRAFIDDAFRNFISKDARSLIIDLRGNPGGDSLFSDVMVAWIADRPFRFYSQFKVRVSPEAIAANDKRIAEDAAAAGPVSQQYRQLYARAKPGDVVDFETPMTPPRPADQRFRGKVYALVNRQSYSQAVAVAATLQDYKFATIIGEPTADMATTYGSMEQFVLPITGTRVGFPKAHIVRPNGDERSAGVQPDIVIETPIVETPADEVLAAAVRLAH